MASKACECKHPDCALVVIIPARGKPKKYHPGCVHGIAINREKRRRSTAEYTARVRRGDSPKCGKCHAPLMATRQGQRLCGECLAPSTKASRGHTGDRVAQTFECKRCFDMPHRRDEPRCYRCNQPHEELPELRLIDFVKVQSNMAAALDHAPGLSRGRGGKVWDAGR